MKIANKRWLQQFVHVAGMYSADPKPVFVNFI